MSTRFVSLLACLAVLPLAVGCDDFAKATDSSKPDEKAKADSTSSAATKKTKKPPPEFSELPANDPLVGSAIQAREEIEQLEEELLQQLDELRSVLASAKAEPDRLRQSVDQFLDLTKSMREKTQQAKAGIQEVSEKTAELLRSSRHLASSFRALAELYRKKARDYSESKLREKLLAFAKDYDDMASTIPERMKNLEAIQKRFPALKRKVQEVHQFLSDAVAFLNSHPGVSTESREQYSKEFQSFAATFSEWLRVLDELRTAIRERAISKVIRESHRQEVVAIQKIELAKRDEQDRIDRAKFELASTEQAKRDEEARAAKHAALEREKLDREREVLAKERERVVVETPAPAKVAVVSSPPVVCSNAIPVVYSQPVVTYRTIHPVIACPPVARPTIVCVPPTPRPNCVCRVTVTRVCR